MIYTANVGGYDFHREDIMCFTDPIGQKTSRMDAKFYKVFPWLFMDTKWSIWVDSNIFLKVSVTQLLSMLNGKGIGVFSHPIRDCIYAEADMCKLRHLDNPNRIDAQMERYRAQGYPEHNGLGMGGVLIRKHTRKIKDLSLLWWKEICYGSTRDQLSLPVVFRDEIQYFLERPQRRWMRKTMKPDEKWKGYFECRPHKKLTIVCFWWGDWCAPYGQEYVRRLQRMFAQHLSILHNFVCFTDRVSEPVKREGIEYRPLPQEVVNWKGNLTKFYAYCPDNDLSGRVVMVDLDTVIVQNVDEMLSYDGDWCGIRAMNPRRHHIGGGLVSFDHEKCAWLWEIMRSQLEKWEEMTNGGERFVYEKVLVEPDLWQNLYPGQIVSYKKHVQQNNGQVPEGAHLVAFHGRPRPHEVDDYWIRPYWR